MSIEFNFFNQRHRNNPFSGNIPPHFLQKAKCRFICMVDDLLIFFFVKRIVFIGYLQKGHTVNGIDYIQLGNQDRISRKTVERSFVSSGQYSSTCDFGFNGWCARLLFWSASLFFLFVIFWHSSVSQHDKTLDWATLSQWRWRLIYCC